jgi:uncharacterized membrane protein
MFGTRYNWLIFTIVLVIGFLIRHFYNMRHAELPNPLAILNELPHAEIVSYLGNIYEHPPWAAEAASAHRPFAGVRTVLAMPWSHTTYRGS